MQISELVQRKAPGHGPGVVTVSPDATVTALLATLAEHNVGAAPVVDADGVVGIVSERDVVRRIAESGAAALGLRVGVIMTRDVVTCGGDDDVVSVAETMTTRRIRHMPVVDDRELVGIVSIGDVVAARIAQLERDRVQLEQYIAG